MTSGLQLTNKQLPNAQNLSQTLLSEKYDTSRILKYSSTKKTLSFESNLYLQNLN